MRQGGTPSLSKRVKVAHRTKPFQNCFASRSPPRLSGSGGGVGAGEGRADAGGVVVGVRLNPDATSLHGYIHRDRSQDNVDLMLKCNFRKE